MPCALSSRLQPPVQSSAAEHRKMHPTPIRLQEILAHGLLRRHPPRPLRRRLKDAIPSPGRSEIPQHAAPSSTPVAAHRFPSSLGPIRALDTPSIAAVFAQLQNRSHVAAPVAIVRRTPHRHDRLVKHLLVPLHDQLMRPRNQGEIIVMVEVPHDVRAEEEARAAGREAPAFDFVGVGPQEVAHGAFVGDFLFAVDEPDFVDGFDEGGEAAVDAEDGAGGG